MRDEYDVEKLNPRKNQYAEKLKQQITINLNRETVDYFKALSAQNGIPYQTLINLYLNDVVENKKELKLKWEEEKDRRRG